MLYVWSVSFLLGCLTAGFTLPFLSLPVFLSLAFGVGLLAARPKLFICSMIFGFLWGVIHNPPITKKDGWFRIVKSQPWCRMQSLLVADESGRFRTFGRGTIGQWGRVSMRSSSPSVFDEASWFEPEGSLPTFWIEKKIRRHFSDLNQANDSILKRWSEALFLGDGRGLGIKLKDSFKMLGIFHLLVISGTHIALFASMMSYVLWLPLRGMYGLRWISPDYWVFLFPFFKVVLVVIIGVFAMATGMSSATQRSLIVFIVLSMSHTFHVPLNFQQRTGIAFFLQTLLFPIGFLSSSNLMSWLAYILVLEQVCQKLSWSRRVCGLFLLQVKLCICVGLAFGGLSIMGVIFNLLVAPIFVITYLFSFFTVFVFYRCEWLVKILIGVLHGLEIAAWEVMILFQKVPFAYIELNGQHWFWRWGAACFSAFFFCQSWRKLGLICNRPK